MSRGTLEVLLVSAKGLDDTDFLSSMDPYAIITCRTQEKKSSVASGAGSSPEWNETFLFIVSGGVTELKIKILDKDTFTDDDFVGEATIPLEPVFAAESVPPTSYSIVKDQEYRGEIRVGLKFTHHQAATVAGYRWVAVAAAKTLGDGEVAQIWTTSPSPPQRGATSPSPPSERAAAQIRSNAASDLGGRRRPRLCARFWAPFFSVGDEAADGEEDVYKKKRLIAPDWVAARRRRLCAEVLGAMVARCRVVFSVSDEAADGEEDAKLFSFKE
ncbi:UNVERIFIED_CONTAM: phloem protein 2 [Sesamum radiatum]|uniref:Phloem protein 2 n=1 Tax=Sesamum radiatum TaxID=300843 RepID=A0AAW2KTL7_SESRA